MIIDGQEKKIGEIILFGGFNDYDCLVEKENIKFSQFWKKNKQNIFYDNSSSFPLLIKFIIAENDLSIQLHPKKSECWYITNLHNQNKIICGNNKIQSKNKFLINVQNKNWDQIINYINIRIDDTIIVPAGTLHAILKGSEMIEVQTPSIDIFRVYDYDRNKKNRPLTDPNLISKHINFENINYKNNPTLIYQVGDSLLYMIEYNLNFKMYIFEIKNDLELGYFLGENFLVGIVLATDNLKINDDTLLNKKLLTFILTKKELLHPIKFKNKGKIMFIIK